MSEELENLFCKEIAKNVKDDFEREFTKALQEELDREMLGKLRLHAPTDPDYFNRLRAEPKLGISPAIISVIEDE